MKNAIYFLLAITLTSAISARAELAYFESCYKERAKNIPSPAEKEFLDSYLIYLKTGKVGDGITAIEKMKGLAKSQGGKFSTRWAGIFEGTMDLCCGGPATCTHSFGSASRSKLWPRVEKGYVTAINLVLTYEQLAKVDGAESSGLRRYTNLIQEKHPWAIRMFKASELVKD